MDLKLADVITWLIVGVLTGSLTGMLVTRRKEGFGRWANLGIGLVGALIGGMLFRVLKINLGLLAQIQVSLQEVVAGLAGALIFLAIIWAFRRYWAGKKGSHP
jgi:uncharacterized membrane protein YeaQ/YmgE (transglycosylase-associated protein family)